MEHFCGDSKAHRNDATALSPPLVKVGIRNDFADRGELRLSLRSREWTQHHDCEARLERRECLGADHERNATGVPRPLLGGREPGVGSRHDCGSRGCSSARGRAEHDKPIAIPVGHEILKVRNPFEEPRIRCWRSVLKQRVRDNDGGRLLR